MTRLIDLFVDIAALLRKLVYRFSGTYSSSPPDRPEHLLLLMINLCRIFICIIFCVSCSYVINVIVIRPMYICFVFLYRSCMIVCRTLLKISSTLLSSLPG